MIRNLLATAIASLLGVASFTSDRASAPPASPPNALAAAPATAVRPTQGADVRQALAAYSQLPLAFEANQGQTDARVRYLSRGLGYSLFLTQSEAVLRLPSAKGGKDTVLRMALEGANPAPTMTALARQGGVTHQYRGSDPANWTRDAAHYGQVRYDEVYPGVDLVYYGNQQRLEYDFIVAPGRDPSTIVMRFTGPEARHLDAEGNLVLSTAQGELLQRKPVLYQQIDGRRVAVEGRYALLDGNRVGFQVGDYDRAHALVIDPVVEYSGWLEGNLNDWANGVAVDKAGNTYLTGKTQSTDFPTTVVGDAPGPMDAFITKINPGGDMLLYSAYIGSYFDDEALAIALDASGYIFLTGDTSGSNQPDLGFPLVNAIQGVNNGYADAWVMKLNPAGSIVYSTLLGGAGHDFGQGIAVTSSGQAYVVGTTQSTNFPTAAARQNANGGGGYRDAFLAKFSIAGTQLLFSTYHGGSGNDYGTGVALDISGNAYITGYTESTDFPLRAPRQSVKRWGNDAYVSKISASGATLVYSTYLGGDGADYAYGIAVDRTGSAYITGSTGSNDFPVANAFQAVRGAVTSHDAFIAKFVPGGNALTYSSLLGGNDHDYAYAIALDAANNAYITGHTESPNFPQVAKVQATSGGDGYDAFVAKVGMNAGKSTLVFSSYLGGPDARESGRGIAVDRWGGVYVAGEELEPANSSLTEVIAAKLQQPMNRVWSGDFDADGKDDVVWRYLRTGANQIWRSGSSATKLTVATMSDTRQLAGVGDFNGDGKSDLLWHLGVGGAGAGDNEIWLSGNSATKQVVGALRDLNWVVAGVGDFNKDGKDDILWHHLVTRASMYWSGGNSAASTALTIVSGRAWEIVGVGDFNGDLQDDVLWRNCETGANVIWRGGLSSAQQSVTAVTDGDWRVVQVADFNGDNKDDILWRDMATGENVIWRSASSATQQAVAVATLDWRAVGHGDYDNNGLADILWRNTQTGANEIWKGANSATKQTVTAMADLSWVASGL